MFNGNYHEKNLIYKFLLCFLYVVIITILFICAYKIFKQKGSVSSWQNVKSMRDYSYIEVFKMSEAFAYYEDTHRQIHFVIEKEDTGLWHTYLIAIDKKDYNKYKDIIDYTYQRVDRDVSPIKVYGYPVIIDKDLKKLAVKNIKKFVPKENEVNITLENFDDYLTNSYMDTTMHRRNYFDGYLFITLFLILIMILLFLFTCFYKEGDLCRIHNKLKKNSDIPFKGDRKYKLIRK